MPRAPGPPDPNGSGHPGAEPASRLVRRLGTFDAVVIGLGSMLGAGIFAALAPAAAAGGRAMLVGLALAAGVAFCNATSTARLAARHPGSGGAYVYGRARLGHRWGFLAGWAFVVGKTASLSAMALTFGAYVHPGLDRALAIASVLALSALNLLGVQKAAWAMRACVAVVLAVLALVVVAAIVGGGPGATPRDLPATGGGAGGILRAAALLFFAFAGYARIATLGEEVRDPARTITRAIPLALGITLGVYALVTATALSAVGPAALAASEAPLAAVVRSSSLAWAVPVVRAGAAVASLGVLLSLLAGVSRTTFAMAAEHDLPAALAAVDPARRVPARAQLAVGAVVVGVTCVADLRQAIGFSSFAVLFYYGVANAAALTLTGEGRRGRRIVPLLGLVGCAALGVSLPPASAFGGALLLLAGLAVWTVRSRRASGAPPDAEHQPIVARRTSLVRRRAPGPTIRGMHHPSRRRRGLRTVPPDGEGFATWGDGGRSCS